MVNAVGSMDAVHELAGRLHACGEKGLRQNQNTQDPKDAVHVRAGGLRAELPVLPHGAHGPARQPVDRPDRGAGTPLCWPCTHIAALPRVAQILALVPAQGNMRLQSRLPGMQLIAACQDVARTTLTSIHACGRWWRRAGMWQRSMRRWRLGSSLERHRLLPSPTSCSWQAPCESLLLCANCTGFTRSPISLLFSLCGMRGANLVRLFWTLFFDAACGAWPSCAATSCERHAVLPC